MSNPITYIGSTQLVGLPSPGGTFFVIGGSDQKTIRVFSLRIALTGSENTAFTFGLVRAANRPSGGTASPVNPTSLDSALGNTFNPSAFINGYVDPPSGETFQAIGGLYTLPVVNGPLGPVELINLTANGGFVLRGIGEIVILSGLGQTFTGTVTALVTAMWTEQ